jgi:hypothetical protein
MWKGPHVVLWHPIEFHAWYYEIWKIIITPEKDDHYVRIVYFLYYWPLARELCVSVCWFWKWWKWYTGMYAIALEVSKIFPYHNCRNFHASVVRSVLWQNHKSWFVAVRVCVYSKIWNIYHCLQIIPSPNFCHTGLSNLRLVALYNVNSDWRL